VLVKLLNTAQRLFVHFHPNNAFAQEHLGCKYGKSEGWIVTDCEGGAGKVYLGFKRGVDLAAARDWVGAQNVPAMLAELNEITVRPGESYFVPGGIPHAIGPGVTVVELQEPTDFSVLMEWEGFGIGPDDGHLGLGFELAMQALDTSAWDARRLAGLRGAVSREPGVHSIFPTAADGFFRAQAVNVAGELSLDPEFSVLVVRDGEGELHTVTGAHRLSAGTVLLLPYAVGPQRLVGTLRALRCRTPAL
jgi:mannose-6-phosphate isomerase